MKNKKTFLFNLERFEILAEYPEDDRRKGIDVKVHSYEEY